MVLGLLRPSTGQDSPCFEHPRPEPEGPGRTRTVPNSAFHTLRRFSLTDSRTASLRPLPPRHSPSERAFQRPYDHRGYRSLWLGLRIGPEGPPASRMAARLLRCRSSHQPRTDDRLDTMLSPAPHLPDRTFAHLPLRSPDAFPRRRVWSPTTRPAKRPVTQRLSRTRDFGRPRKRSPARGLWRSCSNALVGRVAPDDGMRTSAEGGGRHNLRKRRLRAGTRRTSRASDTDESAPLNALTSLRLTGGPDASIRFPMKPDRRHPRPKPRGPPGRHCCRPAHRPESLRGVPRGVPEGRHKLGEASSPHRTARSDRSPPDARRSRRCPASPTDSPDLRRGQLTGERALEALLHQ